MTRSVGKLTVTVVPTSNRLWTSRFVRELRKSGQ